MMDWIGSWIEQIKKTAAMSRGRGRHNMNKREVVLDKFLLHWLKEPVNRYSNRFRYEKVRTKLDKSWGHNEKIQFENDYMLSRLVDFLEMKHYGRNITKEKNKEGK